VTLDAENAFYFLDASNRNPDAEAWDTKIAPSTRFWGAALRFVASLAARDRFLPSMSGEGDYFHSRRKPLLAAPDRLALRQLASTMPPPARAITPEIKSPGKSPEDDPAQLLSGFVEWIMDGLPRVANRPGRPRVLPREAHAPNIASA
jgi:hypothetical protein